MWISDKVKPPNSIVPILNSPSMDHKVLEVMTTESLLSWPPELYDQSMVSLKLIRSKFIVIGWFYLVRIEEIHVLFFVPSLFCHLLEFTSASSDDIFLVTPSNQKYNGRMQKGATLELHTFQDNSSSSIILRN